MHRSTLVVQFRRTLTSLCGLFVLLAAAQVLAAKPRVGVTAFQGHGEGPVRAKVIKALKSNGYQVVGDKQLRATASSASANLDSNDGFAAVAKELAISAFVTGDIAKHKATLTVRNGSDGFVLGEASFNGNNPGKIKAAVAAGFWRRLGSAVSKGTPPAGAKAKTQVAEEAEPADSEDSKGEGSSASESDTKEASEEKDSSASGKDESSEEEEKPSARRNRESSSRSKDKNKEKASASSEGGGGGLKALEIGVGAKALFRKFQPHDDPNPNRTLSNYSVSPAGAAVLWLEAFPMAFSSTGFASNIGIIGGLDKALALTSKTQDGLTTFTTNYLALYGGLKVRFPLSSAVPFVAVTFGKQTYKLVPQAGATRPASILDTDYTYLAGTLGSRFVASSSLSFDVGASYLFVTSPGADITADNHFKNAKAYAVDLGASAVYYITPIIGVRAGLDFRQYGIDFKVTSVNDPIIVGGATDRYVSAWAGVEIALDGAGGP